MQLPRETVLQDRRASILTISVLAFLLVVPRSVVAEKPFSIIDLGTPAGGTSSFATSINERGQVVGYSQQADGSQRAVIFDKGKVIDLGILPGGFDSQAASINNRGVIVGSATIVPCCQGYYHAVRFESGQVIDIGPPGTASDAWGINDWGEIVGDGFLGPNQIMHALIFLGNGMVTDLGVLPGGGADAASIAYAINNRGQAVGADFPVGGPWHPVRFEDGTVTDLGRFPGVADSEPFDGFAFAINNRGQAVGSSPNAMGIGRAVLFENEKVIDLGVPGSAYGINDKDEVVGTMSVGSSGFAFLYDGGSIINLGTLPGYTGSVATGISNRGDIVGYVFSGLFGPRHAVLWTR